MWNPPFVNIHLMLRRQTNVPVIQQNETCDVPTCLSLCSIPYLDYTIDPCGKLFGNTICGINNYQNYLQPNPHYKTKNPGHIDNL